MWRNWSFLEMWIKIKKSIRSALSTQFKETLSNAIQIILLSF